MADDNRSAALTHLERRCPQASGNISNGETCNGAQTINTTALSDDGLYHMCKTLLREQAGNDARKDRKIETGFSDSVV